MTRLTSLDELKGRIALLACVEETEAPVVSAYFNLEDRHAGWREALDERARVLRHTLDGYDLADVDEALGKIEDWLATELLPEAEGAVIFARSAFGGGLMLPMQFAAPLPNWIAVSPTPNIYHLVELKEHYHSYVILLTLPDRASILEVNLGAATTRAWSNRSELRARVGSEWTRLHFQIHQAHRGDRFFQEKIALLEQLMHARGHSHLILAGDPEITARICDALPEDLAEKLVDVVPAGGWDREEAVVMATLSSFIEHEKQQSLSIVASVVEGLRTQNLAVAGSAETLDALRSGKVDRLVMTSDYHPDPGWLCKACRAICIKVPNPPRCPQCGEAAIESLDFRETLLRLASQLECPVEVVEHSAALMSLGGVGCLLRYDPDFRKPERCRMKPITSSKAGEGH